MTTDQTLVSIHVARRCGVERDAELPAYAWPGGYPLFYIVRHQIGGEEVLCPACANLPDHRAGLVCVDVHWEGDPIQCDACGALVESAYGPLEEEVS